MIFGGCGIIENMTTLQIILQIIPLVLLLVATFQKDKWKMMLWSTITNIFYAVMYFSFGRITTACICIVAGIRTPQSIDSLKEIMPDVYEEFKKLSWIEKKLKLLAKYEKILNEIKGE